MPNKQTYLIPPINALLKKYVTVGSLIIDPFAGNNNQFATVTNDLNPNYITDYHLDAYDFLKLFEKNSVDMVLYDPPYSPRQISECYKNYGIQVTQKTTSSKWRAKHLDKIAKILKPNGLLISFGWNTNGGGKKRNFEQLEILDVAHGGSHNDTLATVERKL